MPRTQLHFLTSLRQVRLSLYLQLYSDIWTETWDYVLADMCGQRRLKSVCASAQSDQSFQCLHGDTLHLLNGYRITKIYLFTFDPLKPPFYIVKLGFTGVYLFFLFLLKNIYRGYLLEPPRRGGSNKYPQSMFWAEIWKLQEIFIWKISFFGGKILNIFE